MRRAFGNTGHKNRIRSVVRRATNEYNRPPRSEKRRRSQTVEKPSANSKVSNPLEFSPAACMMERNNFLRRKIPFPEPKPAKAACDREPASRSSAYYDPLGQAETAVLRKETAVSDCRKTFGELESVEPSRIFASSVYDGTEQLFAAENPVSRAKTGEGGMRPGACIPVHRLIKTSFDKQRPPYSEKRRRSVFMRFRFQTCAVRRAGAVPCRLGAARRSGRRECRHTGCRGLCRSSHAQRRRAS